MSVGNIPRVKAAGA